MINVFVSSIFSSIVLLINGIIFIKIVFNKKINEINIWEAGLFGFIGIGFASLILNFFFPINKLLGSIFIICSFIIFSFYFYNLKKKKELILILCFVSLTSFILIAFANINRPDAGLYHLPYISILQENKIILGLTNLHYRFGHTSMFQYISAIYNNHFLKTEFLNLPLASLFPFFLVFLIKQFLDALREKRSVQIISIFLIMIFSLYSFSRYSNYGNDVPASIFFFILIINLLNVKKINKFNLEEFFNISIVSIFLFTLKPSMVIVLLLPLLIFFFSVGKFKILKNKKSLIFFILLLTWLIKNILVSGCAIFPLKETCLKKLYYYNENFTNLASNEAEAWAKNYPDTNLKMNYKEYSSNFNWINTWYNHHFLKIKEKLFPFFIFLLLVFSRKIINRSFYSNFNIKKILKNKNVIYIILFSFYCSTVWFLKFPVYRFGISFISTLMIFLFIAIFVTNKDQIYQKKFYFCIIGIGLILFYAKNLNRIINNYDVNYKNSPWPRIYSFDDNDQNNEKKFLEIKDKNNNFIFYYSGGEKCMYSKSPCSNYNNKNLVRKIVNNYSTFYIKD
tara:strand:+ start:154 stop:1851 length:1698 start_codon:yes stop_codon:yes gene_type:complete